MSISQEDLARALKKARFGPSPGALSHSDFAKLIESGGVDIIEPPDVPGQKPVLTVTQHEEMLRKCDKDDEHMLIAIMTPILSAVCAEVGASFVNSEEEQWIPTTSDDPANFLRPDAFSSVIHVHSVSKEHRLVELGDLRRQSLVGGVFEEVFQFGSPVWDLRDIYVVWEFKWRVSLKDRGTAYNYLVNLSRDDYFNTYFVLLCDSEHFYITTAKNGNVSSRVDKYAWSPLGAVEALQRVLSHKNARVRLLQGLCTDLRLSVSGFLGAGATGRCFSVRGTTAPEEGQRALKAVLTCHRDSKTECASAEALALGEFLKLEALAAVVEPEPMPVVRVVSGSLSRVYHDGVLLGVGYLMLDVGQPMVPLPNTKIRLDTLKLLFASLSVLHRRGHYHGDARIQNAVFVRGHQVVWIDFVWGSEEAVGVNGNRKKLEDVVALIDSIFEGEPFKTDEELMELLNQYGANLENSDLLATHLAGLPQRRVM